ncbi:hypothetical protein BDA96_10G285100 [Sorghum bicolor]|uniref:X8 domain-containing protein n=2 Tax=Sorghum bicolor TaxID=4558 RepID=A0A921Q798_SORBI|nr:proline-rich receptor-like protein kinase PERK8 [Sorghum bicolor]EER90180.2 hypothetical protein SORBI_3010G220300 [Sorghum bicolor]KAG0515512.1 hypothetical protein BDA96_10G285100 [Sorghum bicolor]|eukprot:XP_021306141.1 proline-rich receptor-like protein kinase PERK8 [Sorghum bicolor]
MIKNCSIFILAPIIFMQYDWANASARTRDYSHLNIVNSPSLPPYKDVIGGAPAPAANVPPSPPYCVYPPPAKPALPAPLLPVVASAPGASNSPPAGPPSIAPSSPGSSQPQPAPLFLPPVAFPAPPPGHARPAGLWCVANPAAASTVVQAAMDYACGSGADCSTMAAPGGPCYLPDTLVAHSSYAFNSYWQRTRVAGGTCDFGGAAMLVTRDPSYDGCQYIYM